MSETTRRRLNGFLAPIVTAVLAVVGTLLAGARNNGALEQRVTTLEHRVDGHDSAFQRFMDSQMETNTRLGRIEGILNEMRGK